MILKQLFCQFYFELYQYQYRFFSITSQILIIFNYHRKRSVSVYPDAKFKPPIGEGLNKSCTVELLNVWPTKKITRALKTNLTAEEVDNFTDKLEKMNESTDSKFINYNHLDGTWTFEVKHFSKYGFDEDSDDTEVKKSFEQESNYAHNVFLSVNE